jgi:transcriptional regulator with XRE-family HTH domain
MLPIGHQIRRLRLSKRLSLNDLARRASTSAPALHRYENGWNRFEIATLRKIASALGARLDVRLVPREPPAGPRSRRELAALLSPVFWDRELAPSDLDDYPEWVLARVLMFGSREQVAGARRHFGDEAIRRVIERRVVDARTRNYWRLVLGETTNAPQGP